MAESPEWRFHGGRPPVPGAPLDHASPAWTPVPEFFDTAHQPGIPVRMSDGTRLLVDITRPVDPRTGQAPSRRVPVILEQTPYRRVAYEQCPPEAAARFFVTRGYIYALAQVRGSASSEGTIGFLDDREQRDGVELVQWASALEGSDGTVALNGDSYAGLNQFFTVARCVPGHPVRAIAAGYLGPDLLREPFTVGGLPTEVGTAFWNEWLTSVADGDAHDRASHVWVSRLAENMADRTGLAFDDDWWMSRRTASTVERVVANNVPALLWTSAGDFYRDSLPRLYAMLQNCHMGRPLWHPMAPGQPVTPQYQLSIGPVEETHSSGGQPIQPGGPRDAAALRWFDRWVKGVPSDTSPVESTVRYIEMHTDAWRETGSWPPTLHYDHHHLDLACGALLEAGQAPSSAVTSVKIGAEQPLLCALEPFHYGRSFAGPISVTLAISSESPDVLVTVRLHLLDAAGRAKPLPIAGAQLASCRTLDDEHSWYDSQGEVIAPVLTMAGPIPNPSDLPMRLVVELKSLPFGVGPDEQLLLEIACGASEDEDGIPPQARIRLPATLEAELGSATFQVHSSAEHRSFLSLPAGAPAKSSGQSTPAATFMRD